ncbi:MAG: hypothetical protein UD936_02900, partial [Acutalibacteraceae bacterium]|nr:hypothetical protein [Acutalibacteraceae bacterium]
MRFRLAWVNHLKAYYTLGVLLCLIADGLYLSAFLFLTIFWRCLPISNKELQINDEIRDKEIRVINSDGSQLGLMSAVKALEIAESQNL